MKLPLPGHQPQPPQPDHSLAPQFTHLNRDVVFNQIFKYWFPTCSNLLWETGSVRYDKIFSRITIGIFDRSMVKLVSSRLLSPSSHSISITIFYSFDISCSATRLCLTFLFLTQEKTENLTVLDNFQNNRRNKHRPSDASVSSSQLSLVSWLAYYLLETCLKWRNMLKIVEFSM